MDKEQKSPHLVDIHVGSRVRTRRIMLGLSQGKLGEAIGVTFQQIQKYEHGTTRISCSMLVGIARALGVDPAFFFAELDRDATPAADPLSGLNAAGVKVALEASTLSPQQQGVLLSVIRGMRYDVGARMREREDDLAVRPEAEPGFQDRPHDDTPRP